MNDRFRPRMSVAQLCAVKDIDEKAALRNLRAMLSRRARHPGKLFIPGVCDMDAYYEYAPDKLGYYNAGRAKADKDLSLAEYIARFDKLNHLKPVTYVQL